MAAVRVAGRVGQRHPTDKTKLVCYLLGQETVRLIEKSIELPHAERWLPDSQTLLPAVAKVAGSIPIHLTDLSLVQLMRERNQSLCPPSADGTGSRQLLVVHPLQESAAPSISHNRHYLPER